MDINYNELKLIANDQANKGQDCELSSAIRNNMYPFSKNFMSYLESLDCYEVSTIFLDYGHWEKSRKRSFDSASKPFRYNLRDIVLINLGACNYGYEASYEHPCIILANGFNWVLVIPCSTGRYKVQSDYILKGERIDGFKEKTGIQLDKIRVVDKWRISGKIVGKVSATKFQEINDQILHLFFPQIEHRIDKYKIDAKITLEEISKLKETIKNLEKRLEHS